MDLNPWWVGFSANVVLGVFLLFLSGIVVRWMKDRRAGAFHAMCLALVWSNYLMDGARASTTFFPGSAWNRFIGNYDTNGLSHVVVLLDPLPLLLFALAATGRRLSPLRLLLVAVPVLAVCVATWVAEGP